MDSSKRGREQTPSYQKIAKQFTQCCLPWRRITSPWKCKKKDRPDLRRFPPSTEGPNIQLWQHVYKFNAFILYYNSHMSSAMGKSFSGHTRMAKAHPYQPAHGQSDYSLCLPSIYSAVSNSFRCPHICPNTLSHSIAQMILYMSEPWARNNTCRTDVNTVWSVYPEHSSSPTWVYMR